MYLFKYYCRRIVLGLAVPVIFLALGGAILWCFRDAESNVPSSLGVLAIGVTILAGISLVLELWSILIRDNFVRWQLNRNYRNLGKAYKIWPAVLAIVFLIWGLDLLFLVVTKLFWVGELDPRTISSGAINLALLGLMAGIVVYFVLANRLKSLGRNLQKLKLKIPSRKHYQEILQQNNSELCVRLVDPMEFQEVGQLILFPQNINLVITNHLNEVLFVITKSCIHSKNRHRYIMMDAQGNKMGEINNIQSYWWRVYEILVPHEKKNCIDFGGMTQQLKSKDFGEIIINSKCSAVTLRKIQSGDFGCEIFDGSNPAAMMRFGTLKTAGTYEIDVSIERTEKQLLILSLAVSMILEKVQTGAIGFLFAKKRS